MNQLEKAAGAKQEADTCRMGEVAITPLRKRRLCGKPCERDSKIKAHQTPDTQS
jgi:hypothetical protein